MTAFLQSRGIRVIESDLGDRIQQLDGQPRSHIVFPAIHKTRQDAAHLFARTIGSDPDNDDPHALTEIMRNNARPRFLAAGAGMTGGNFAIVLRSSSHLPLRACSLPFQAACYRRHCGIAAGSQSQPVAAQRDESQLSFEDQIWQERNGGGVRDSLFLLIHLIDSAIRDVSAARFLILVRCSVMPIV